MTRKPTNHAAPLVLEWDGGCLRLSLEVAGRIESVDEVIPVPGAPSGVIGLGETRGRPVTLLCPSLFAPPDEPVESPALLRSQVSALTFAPPYSHLGVLVTRSTTLRRAGDEDEKLVVVDAQRLERTIGELIGACEAAE